jgi:glycosyltransferase involved in cell wall biosynthesis
MKVLYDHQIFETQKIGGISRYFVELVKCFQQTKKVQWQVSVKYSENNYLGKWAGFQQTLLPLTGRKRSHEKGNRLIGKVYKEYKKLFRQRQTSYEQLNKEDTIALLKSGEFDVFHPTYYDDYFLDYLGNKPFVLTVHDLIIQIFPEYFLGYTFVDKTKKILDRADHLIAISEQTKKDLIDFFGIEENKITVIYHGCSLKRFSDKIGGACKLSLPDEYVLYVGNRGVYKNFYFAIQAIAGLLRNRPGLYLVCTGDLLNDHEIRYLDKLGIRSKIKQVFADETELPYLYTNAAALIYPTLYEGFGLPILEAFSCGCPVVCSRSSSLTEVGGDAVVYFNPKSNIDILQSVEAILDNKTLRNSNIERGYQQLKKFTWLQSAALTEEVYQKVLRIDN